MSTSVTSLTRTGGSPPKAPANRVLIIFGALGTVAFVICANPTMHPQVSSPCKSPLNKQWLADLQGKSLCFRRILYMLHYRNLMARVVSNSPSPLWLPLDRSSGVAEAQITASKSSKWSSTRPCTASMVVIAQNMACETVLGHCSILSCPSQARRS